jgi:hypothetical protein
VSHDDHPEQGHPSDQADPSDETSSDQAEHRRDEVLEHPPVDASTVSEQAVVLDHPTLDSTGDQVVDAVLEQFDRVTGEPLATHIEAAEKVQDTLQSRLSDLGDG